MLGLLLHTILASMKVKLAVMSRTLQFLSKTSKDFENCDATIRFIRVVDEIFDFLNSRNPYVKGFKQPINRQNIQYLETKMKKAKMHFTTPLMNFEFFFKKDVQDAIELFFGFMRGRFGHNNNPICLQFKNALKTPEQNLENELDISLLAEQYNELDFNSITIENILYYICGYSVKKLIPTLKCDGCIDAVTDPYIENDHVYQYNYNTTPKYFTIMKNRGGLMYASDRVYKIVKLKEILFKTIMVDKKQMFIKNMDLKIMISVQNALATDTTLFPECNTCWNSTDLLARPHKIDIINKVTRTYLN
ncbi:THAP-type domain-containing protein, partial [Aphis craccivora]